LESATHLRRHRLTALHLTHEAHRVLNEPRFEMTDMPNPADISSAAPPTLNHVVGQKQATELLKVALAAFWNDRAAGRNPSFGSCLFVGPPGVGKTLFSQLIARELCGPLKECLGQTLGLGEDVYALLMGLAPDSVLFIDESHLLSPFVQTILFRAIEEQKLYVPKGPVSSKYTAVPLNRFTTILATTDEHSLLPPLRDRMKLTLRFTYYEASELAELCRQRAHALRWNVETEVFNLIAQRSKGTPRFAIRLLEGGYRTARAEGADAITVAHFHRTCQLEGLDAAAGLDKTEQEYLKLLARSPDKPVRLNVISSVVGLPSKTIADVTEKFLLRDGLIIRSDSGRTLTEKGYDYVLRHLQPHPKQ
jgi:Holliday junction DNA helicase RuvB